MINFFNFLVLLLLLVEVVMIEELRLFNVKVIFVYVIEKK